MSPKPKGPGTRAAEAHVSPHPRECVPDVFLAWLPETHLLVTVKYPKHEFRDYHHQRNTLNANNYEFTEITAIHIIFFQ